MRCTSPCTLFHTCKLGVTISSVTRATLPDARDQETRATQLISFAALPAKLQTNVYSTVWAAC